MRRPACSVVALCDRMVALSDAMYAAAEADDWDRVVQLERERREVISAAFAAVPPVAEAAVVAAAVERVLARDREVLARARARRDQAAAALGGMARGRRADQAYRAAQRGG